MTQIVDYFFENFPRRIIEPDLSFLAGLETQILWILSDCFKTLFFKCFDSFVFQSKNINTIMSMKY